MGDLSVIEIFQQLRWSFRISFTQRGMELNGNGTIRVHECGVPERRHLSAIKVDLDIKPR
jgi:hypothetical protein